MNIYKSLLSFVDLEWHTSVTMIYNVFVHVLHVEFFFIIEIWNPIYKIMMILFLQQIQLKN